VQCLECGDEYVNTTEPIQVNDPLLGGVRAEGVVYLKCRSCGDTMLPLDAARAIEEAREEKRKTLLGAYPIEEFVTSAEAQKMLGMSRQAFSKHRRIKRGFIYWVVSGSQKMYLRASVEQFSRTNDGRLPLGSRTSFRAPMLDALSRGTRRLVFVSGESSTHTSSRGHVAFTANNALRPGRKGRSHAQNTR
jgi:hypothetical protein